MQKQLTAIIEREEHGYVSLCPELDIAGQGSSIEEAKENLREALELFFETASPEEVRERLHEEEQDCGTWLNLGTRASGRAMRPAQPCRQREDGSSSPPGA